MKKKLARKFWRSRNGMTRVNLAISRCQRLMREDIYEVFLGIMNRMSKQNSLFSWQFLRNLAEKLQPYKSQDESAQLKSLLLQEITHTSSSTKPVIFVSACVSEQIAGGWKYNGGIKELNYLVKLLRQHGYEAYMVTYDGSYEPWLIEHQPHLSLKEFCSQLRMTSKVRCITSYAVAKAFNHECKQLYFWDMELALTENSHFSLIAELYKSKIKRSAGISCTIQAWHMAHFQHDCTLLPNLVDQSIWFPLPEQRQSHRIGYMDEGSHTDKYLSIIQDTVRSNGLDLQFYKIQGIEADVLASMRSCEVFLTMNIGKDLIWGEGGPLTPLEAMATGCVPITFDIIGPHEIIQNGFNGIIVPRYRPDLMAEALVNLYKKPDRLEYLRKNVIALFEACHTFDARWPAVKNFLELDIDEENYLEEKSKLDVNVFNKQLQALTYGEYFS
jgi:glycosyltransferase involved in cell wall biosynthesis